MINDVLIWQRRCPTFRVQRIGQRLEPISFWSKQWTRHRGSNICVSQFRSRPHRMVTPILTSAGTEARVNIEAEVKRREAEATGYGGGGGQGPGGCLRAITTLLCGSRARCRSHYLLANNLEDIAPPGPVVTGVMTMVSPGPWPASPSSGVWSRGPGLGSSRRLLGRRTDTKWGLSRVLSSQTKQWFSFHVSPRVWCFSPACLFWCRLTHGRSWHVSHVSPSPRVSQVAIPGLDSDGRSHGDQRLGLRAECHLHRQDGCVDTDLSSEMRHRQTASLIMIHVSRYRPCSTSSPAPSPSSPRTMSSSISERSDKMGIMCGHWAFVGWPLLFVTL